MFFGTDAPVVYLKDSLQFNSETEKILSLPVPSRRSEFPFMPEIETYTNIKGETFIKKKLFRYKETFSWINPETNEYETLAEILNTQRNILLYPWGTDRGLAYWVNVIDAKPGNSYDEFIMADKIEITFEGIFTISKLPIIDYMYVGSLRKIII